MNERVTDAREAAASRLGRALHAASLSIRWERMWRVFWAPLAVILLFIGIALTDVLTALPDIVHGAILALLAALFGLTLTGLRGAFRPVGGAEAARRVETASGLKHRPLTALFDTPAHEKLSPDAEALWQTHVKRAVDQTRFLKYPAPKPGLAALDPMGLRFVPVLVLFVGILIGGSDPVDRLLRAVTPVGPGDAARQVRMDMWITPPAYTGLAPTVFNGIQRQVAADDEAAQPPSPLLIVPVGTQILVHATDSRTQPALRLGAKDQPMDRLGDKASTSYKLETTVGADAVGADRLTLKVGGDELAEWPVRIALDSAPTIEFERAPSRRRDTQLDVAYLAGDDYGVKTITMTIRRPGGQPVPGGEAEILTDLPISGDRRNIKGASARDFSAHPWAGLPVRVTLTAEDTAGQKATTEAVEVVLPERIFNHPIARGLAEARKALNDPSEDVRKAVSEEVHQLSLRPKQYFDDTVAFLAMRSAAGRLAYGEDAADIPGIQKLLWETALRIEDGEYALAEADLMRLQEEAMKALQEGKLGEELDRVMQELQEAMQRYMEALTERLQEMGLDQLPQMGDMQNMQVQDLQQMMDKIRELAETGNREAAEQMLAEMQRMLEQMRQGMQMQQSNPAMAEAKKLMDQLRSLTEEQQQLLDRTFERANRENGRDPYQRPRFGLGQPPQQGQQRQQMQQGQRGQQQQQGQDQQQGQQAQEGQNGQPSQADQEALRQRLGELMMQMDELMGQIPDNMGRAEQQMEQAGKNMGKGEFRDATGNQSQALQELRDATGKMAEQMAQQFGSQMGVTSGTQPMPGGQSGFDPFGRRNTQENGQGTAVEDADVELPSRMELRRAREILDELRRRSGDRNRPPVELDYIERLLDIF